MNDTAAPRPCQSKPLATFIITLPPYCMPPSTFVYRQSHTCSPAPHVQMQLTHVFRKNSLLPSPYTPVRMHKRRASNSQSLTPPFFPP
ncbi:importin subunit beta-1 [Histoplasma ohiense]|nr:importin subunit beta-1 [Histoplasma ohiense (nom. inval.)]